MDQKFGGYRGDRSHAGPCLRTWQWALNSWRYCLCNHLSVCCCVGARGGGDRARSLPGIKIRTSDRFCIDPKDSSHESRFGLIYCKNTCSGTPVAAKDASALIVSSRLIPLGSTTTSSFFDEQHTFALPLTEANAGEHVGAYCVRGSCQSLLCLRRVSSRAQDGI